MFLKLVETCLIHSCTHDRPHRCFVGLGEGEAPTALLAFHQLIVKRTAVAEVRDRGESDGFKTKKVTRNVVRSSHLLLDKTICVCFVVKIRCFGRFWW